MLKIFKRSIDIVKKESVGGYVSVKVINNKELSKWYEDQGLKTIPYEELHCTIAYSKQPFKRILNHDEIIVKSVHPILEPLGDNGCVVLKLNSRPLEIRFQECINAGAVYDYPFYIPHITIGVNVTGDLSKYKSPNFDIILGLESIEELNTDYSYND